VYPSQRNFAPKQKQLTERQEKMESKEKEKDFSKVDKRTITLSHIYLRHQYPPWHGDLQCPNSAFQQA
jgi:hypothetical protein